MEEDPPSLPSVLERWLDFGMLVDASTSGLGGNYEGRGRILTVVSGVGALAVSGGDGGGRATAGGEEEDVDDEEEGHRRSRPNVWAPAGDVDEAGLSRSASPLAGSFSLHHNVTHYVARDGGIAAGGEVVVDRNGWFRKEAARRRREVGGEGKGNDDDDDAETTTREDESGASKMSRDDRLRSIAGGGVCMDNLHYGSSPHGYGRGAIASRALAEGSIVAPVPVLPLPRDDIRYLRYEERKRAERYRRRRRRGNESTTTYGGVVEEEYDDDAPLPPDMRSSPEGLALEMFALRDIRPNEEVLLDYGPVWRRAWDAHVRRWYDDLPPSGAGTAGGDDYTPAYVMDDAVSILRTAEEQAKFPYPDNVFTACFYRYAARDDEAGGGLGGDGTDESRQSTTASASTGTKRRTEALPWRMSPGLFDMINLRPCKVIAREDAQQQRRPSGKGGTVYTAIVQNRPGLPPNERIPRGERHVVSGIPRGAFRFVDRPYTSDAHLDGALRQNIGLEEGGIYPEIWLDVVG
ncbi:hypothetical protein ACHAW5_005799 [Stephanodiscus triporus]|uniref:SET domain-containing protein n=1 Tax=Stephanodiscus triporus TaxID=2934178 RepID=A0ABD3PTG4_9STRA